MYKSNQSQQAEKCFFLNELMESLHFSEACLAQYSDSDFANSSSLDF